jgi:hypothetical protein
VIRELATHLGPTVYVDPGVTKGHGVACFSSTGALATCGVQTEPVASDECARIAVETPTIAFAGTVPTIIALARAAERAVRNWPEDLITYVPPQDWKAGTKSQHQAHAWGVLTDAEEQVVVRFCVDRGLRLSTAAEIEATLRDRCAKSAAGKRDTEWVLGNVIDAIGLGLWCLGRIDKFGRVNPAW